MARLTTALALLALGSTSCYDGPPDYIVSIQSPHLQRLHDGGYLSATFLVTDGAGHAVPCTQGELTVKAKLKRPDGTWAPIDASEMEVLCDDGQRGDLAVVVDNSGSEDGYLPLLQTGARNVVRKVVERGGSASLTRISTDSTVLVGLTDSRPDLFDGVTSMHIADGWTSLYDGVRIGNETLSARDDLGPSSECGKDRVLGMVVFTDGQDNNSADEKAGVIDTDQYPGDGIDTTFADLRGLEVNGIETPIYTIGLGDGIAEVELTKLAERSGGRYLHVEKLADIPKVFNMVGDYFDAEHQVCANIGDMPCGEYTLVIDWTWESEDGTIVSGSTSELTDVPCDDIPDSRIVTTLLTFSDPGISKATASALANQSVAWAAPNAKKVLVVLDDNHHGEDKGDGLYIVKLLTGYSVSYKDEPKAGLTIKDLEAYDAVWLTNPGYPPDDRATIDALRTYSADGGGVILSGDDMTWTWGKKLSMAPLTHLKYKDNGVRACGIYIDNNRGSTYTVNFDKGSKHPVVGKLAGTSFKYGNDIDRSFALGEGEMVLATAQPTADSKCPSRPVVVAYEPPEEKK
ncbi:MAG: Mg-chelatase subunit ChlD [Kiritimatiellia bacterium]|jgi:Mg-chelatase subunit ChlD